MTFISQRVVFLLEVGHMNPILTAEQRERLILFLREVGKDGDRYFVRQEDGLFYTRFPSRQEPVRTSDAEMLELALTRAGLGLEYGVVHNIGFVVAHSSECSFQSFREMLVRRVGHEKRVDEVLGCVFPPQDSETDNKEELPLVEPYCDDIGAL